MSPIMQVSWAELMRGIKALDEDDGFCSRSTVAAHAPSLALSSCVLLIAFTTMPERSVRRARAAHGT